MTEKLYYQNSRLARFSARVTACEKTKDGWAISLDKTAFFPEGGGQLADTGVIGAVRVTDVQERGGEIWHCTAAPLEPGAEYACAIDAEQRRRRMQNHSGEHVVSGITHRLHGANNVGFHMGGEFMTIDFDKELTWAQLMEIERLANEAVRDNIPIKAWFPTPGELAALDYRSKLELTENVRIVEIAGIDTCACCAPHVAATGEIGLIKVLDSMRHRGGVRISLVCGMDALDAVRVMQENVTAVSKVFSAPRNDTGAAAARFAAGEQKLKERIAELSMAAVRMRAESTPECAGNICVFDELLDEVALRELVNMLCEKCTGYAAAFSGNDDEGYRYIIGSRHVDLKKRARDINAGIDGRGGGRSEMLQGRAAKNAESIRKFIKSDNV